MTAPARPRHDRRPPHDETAEQAVLSAMMLDRAAIAVAREQLIPECFYREAHRRVYQAILALEERGAAPDPVSLADELRRREELHAVGGVDYVAQLLDAVPTAANIAHHAAIVRQHAQRRLVIAQAQAAIEALYQGLDPATVAKALSADVLPMAVDDAAGLGYQRIDPFAVLDEIEARMRGDALAYPSGIAPVDAQTHGFRPGELIILGGVPKAGKSLVAHNLAAHAASLGHPVGIVSAEMSAAQVTERLLSALSGVPLHVSASGRLQAWQIEKLTTAAARLAKLPLYIDDAASPSLDDVLARAVALKAQHSRLGVIVVDFLQLVRFPLKGRRGDEELTSIAYALKGLAKRTKTAVVAPAQLNYKDIEKRPDKRPQLQDLAGSSGMLQAADFVALLYREAMYWKDRPDILELDFRACRRTAPFAVSVWWNGGTMSLTAQGTAGEAAPAQHALGF
ncbi:MAG: hypothetical protein ABS52_16575 [Gemmatimonadetes bacterium SCN 70-22]|nr:MAG: hypothetical protein ABS52_16575 [Gemmatimonadetes bacterium SCN 70-22]